MSEPSDFIVTVGEETPTPNEETRVKPSPPEMKSMHVVSNVRNRYGRTVVTSKYVNQDKHAQQATFSIVLPDTAFITGFVMEINEKKYEAYVKEKEEAKQEYQAAVSSGRAAAHVAVSARDSNKFTVSVNVEPQSDVTFILTYEELLVRKHGKYEMVVNLHLAQLLEDFGVDIYINETRPVINIETPAIRSGNEITDKVAKNKYATIKKDTDGAVHVSFHPTIPQQKQMTNTLSYECTSQGVLGQFVVEYDVERDPLGGEVLVNDGYFVHFFAPTELKAIPKHVVFVLDVSGSMHGRKIEQLKEAMKVILNELNPDDYFNIILFSNYVNLLFNSNPSPEVVNISLPASAENINNAQKVVDRMEASGGTNISDALITALKITSKRIVEPGRNTNRQPIIVFLTDGQANFGEPDPHKIIEIVAKQNDCDNISAIFTLAFGNDANNEFLKELAMKNSGFLRNIYEAADASLQLQDFYKQISSPVLTNIKFKYPEEVKEVTNQKFDILFDGSEMVVTGKVDEMVDGFVFVEGSTLDGINKFSPSINTICLKPDEKEKYGNLERLWAYMTIKQLLAKKYEKETSEGNETQPDKNTTEEETAEKLKNAIKTEKEKVEKQALKLALKYSFVTPVTSLIVVKPDEPASEGELLDSHENPISTSNDSPQMVNCKKTIIKKKALRRPIKDEDCEIISVEDDNDNPFEKILLVNYQIDCNVKNHIASTVERRNFSNSGDKPHDTTFTIELPDKTVFTEFAMEIEGQVFKSVGRDEQAKIEYQEAISSGLNTALINLQDSNKITVSIHLVPNSKATMIFKYTQCLVHKNGIYEIAMNIERELWTEIMAVNVFLNEAKPIKNITILPLRSKHNVIRNRFASIKKINENEAHIKFSPTIEQQEDIANALKLIDKQISEKFFMEYEVESDPSADDSVTSAGVAIPFPYLIVKSNN